MKARRKVAESDVSRKFVMLRARTEAVEDADGPAVGGETPVPGADITLGVGVHLCVAAVPEEPDVFLVGYWFGMEQIMIDF